MKLSIRRKLGNILIYGFISPIQRVDGLQSKIKKSDDHIVLWDFDEKNFNAIKWELEDIQLKYNLGDIFIMSDKDNSYRAFSLTSVTFKTLLKILIETKGVDYNFFRYTVKREYATIRITNKKNREPNKIIYSLKTPFNIRIVTLNNLNFEGYETDLDVLKVIV